MLIKSLKVAGGTVTINFTGPTGNPPPAYNLFSSRTANGIYTIDDRAGIIELSPGLFQATAPTSGRPFYRIGR
jgi:hypothetical protein